MSDVRFTVGADNQTGPALGAAASEFKRLATTVLGAYVGFEAFKKILGGAIGEFNEGELALKRLGTALKNMGHGGEGNIAALAQQAKEFSAAFGIEGDEIMRFQALATTMGVLPSQMESVTQAALDLSAATGVSLETALRDITKAATGQTMALERMLPGLDLAKAKAGGLKPVLEALARVHGAAADRAGTQQGALDRLGVAWKDFLGVLGRGMAAGGSGGVIGFATRMLDTAGKTVQSLGLNFEGVARHISGFLALERDLNSALARGSFAEARASMDLYGKLVAKIQADQMKGLDEIWNGKKKEAEVTDGVTKALAKAAAAEKEAKGAKDSMVEAWHEELDAMDQWIRKNAELRRAAKARTDEDNRGRDVAIKGAEEFWDETFDLEDNAIKLIRGMEDQAAKARAKAATEAQEEQYREMAMKAGLAGHVGATLGSAFSEGMIGVVRSKSAAEATRAAMKAAVRAGINIFGAVISTVGGPWGQAVGAVVQSLSGLTELFHTGGVVGVGPLPRAHGGAVIGGRGEVPIIAQAGEGVIDAETMQAMMAEFRRTRGTGGTRVTVAVSATDARSFQNYMGREGERAFRRMATGGHGALGVGLRSIMPR